MVLHGNKWIVLAVMCLLTVMLNIDATAVNLAIPIISTQFHAQLTSMQWVINAFVLLTAMLQIFGGRLGDILERRSLFNFGTILFVVASIIAGVSHGVVLLIAGRVLQGIALGIAYPITIVITYSVFPKEQHGTAMGIIMGVMGLSLAAGPTLGGFIIELANWRWIFYVNVPIGILALVMSFLFVPKSKKETRSVGELLDFPGTVLLMLGLLGVILALNESQNWGFASLEFLTVFGLGSLCLILLFFVENHAKNPVVDFSVFKIRNFNLNLIIRLVSQMIFIPVLFFIPLYLVNIVGDTPVKTGFIVLVMTLVVGIISPIVGKWVDATGDKLPTVVSSIFYVIGCACLAFLTNSQQTAVLIFGLVFIGIGCGISFVSTTSGALNVIPEKISGMATGVFLTVAWVSCALAISVCGAILAKVSQKVILSELSQKNIALSSAQMDLLVRNSRGLVPFSHISSRLPPHLLDQLKPLADYAFMGGLSSVMWFLCVCAFVSLILGLILI